MTGKRKKTKGRKARARRVELRGCTHRRKTIFSRWRQRPRWTVDLTIPEAAAFVRGDVGADPIGALGRLGLARADALQGNSSKAKAEYQDFLTTWKDADQDIARSSLYRKFLTSIRFDSAN